MYDLDQLSNAVAQITGEALEGARARLSTLDRFDLLIPAASRDQALMESALATALGAVKGQSRPLGVREAKPVAEGLILRLERSEDVQSLFGLLPYRAKKGTWHGVRGMQVQPDRAQLRFGLRSWLCEPRWRSPEPAVWVAGPHGEDLADLLATYQERTLAAGHTVQWDPQCPEDGPKRKEPVTRSLLRQLAVSSAMGSALLRRPRLWDSLAGFAGMRVATRMSDHGLDWIVERHISGSDFDEDRLVAILADRIVGLGLNVLDHTCSTDTCTISLARQPGNWLWRGVLSVETHQASTEPRAQGSGRRPLTAINEHRNASRPQAISERPDDAASGETGTVVQLISAPVAPGVGRDELARIGEQIAAAWASRGLAAAVIVIKDRSLDRIPLHDPGLPPWAKAQVPTTGEYWRRLRIVPPPGELWSLEASGEDDKIHAALDHARRSYERVLLIGRRDRWFHLEEPAGPLVDLRVLVHRAQPYERHIPVPGTDGRDAKTIKLTPAESAIQWRQQEFGRWTPQHPISGMLLLSTTDETAPLDSFEQAVEEQLGRYGTPVLGRFPASGPFIQGPGHSLHPPTVLDPRTEEQGHWRMATAADMLAQRLWPRKSPATESATSSGKALDVLLDQGSQVGMDRVAVCGLEDDRRHDELG